jgi:hypothetical protein
VEYTERWQIPENRLHEPIPRTCEEGEWTRSSEELSSFIVKVNRQVIHLSFRRLSLLRVSVIIYVSLPVFLQSHGMNDDLAGHSAFRMHWWILAKDNGIDCP